MFVSLTDGKIIETNKIEERHDGIRVTEQHHTLSCIAWTIPFNQVVSITITKPS